MDWWIYLIIGIVVLLVLIFIWIFNTLVVLRNRINNAWSQINVQLKKRNDLIPNLVETVKGYAKYEKKVFTEVTKARTSIMNAKTLAKKAQASDMLTNALKSLFAVAENYPKLEASKNFLMLQEELSGIESKIAYARQFYNDSVLKYNNRIQTFPANMLAGGLGHKTREYFKVAEVEKKVPKVKIEV